MIGAAQHFVINIPYFISNKERINMRKTMKRFLSVVLTFALVCSFSACSKGGGESSAGTASGSSAESASGSPKIDTSEHVKVTMLVLGNKPTNGRMQAALAEQAAQ